MGRKDEKLIDDILATRGDPKLLVDVGTAYAQAEHRAHNRRVLLRLAVVLPVIVALGALIGSVLTRLF